MRVFPGPCEKGGGKKGFQSVPKEYKPVPQNVNADRKRGRSRTKWVIGFKRGGPQVGRRGEPGRRVRQTGIHGTGHFIRAVVQQPERKRKRARRSVARTCRSRSRPRGREGIRERNGKMILKYRLNAITG